MLRMAILAGIVLPAVALAQGPFPEPKTFPPDAATLKKIQDKTEELRKALDAVPEKHRHALPSVEVFHKAAEWIVRHKEWYSEKSAQQTLDILEVGLKRAAALKDGKTPWLKAKGKPIALGFQYGVDRSVQPFSLSVPEKLDPKKPCRVDIVLHGRDGTLNEVKFLHAAEFAKPNPNLDHYVVQVYGRGNNAYRWAGETDVIEAKTAARAILDVMGDKTNAESWEHPFIRGFSMGGAGTWHIGLHHSWIFRGMSPGAGFTTTHGYIGNLPKQLPDYVEKCLRIYDAVDYAENAFNIPVIAYSGEKDPQKAAADNIEKALKDFKEPHIFKHLVAPGLQHQQPAAWSKKIDDEFNQIQSKPRKVSDRIRLVTYTLKYPFGEWLAILRMEQHYERAVVDVTWDAKGITATTQNVRSLLLTQVDKKKAIPNEASIDGQTVKIPQALKEETEIVFLTFSKVQGKWQVGTRDREWPPQKEPQRAGPIDDAFTRSFVICTPTDKPWHSEMESFTQARKDQFVALWDKWFRGKVPLHDSNKPLPNKLQHDDLILFGDPQSNPLIAEHLPNLPIKWTKDELVMNGVTYDAKTHIPVLIYPRRDRRGYLVLNSGHTFGEADLRGTNALLYPRLGDWAVLKPAPTKQNPAAFEVVAAGLFDDFWQFPKKK